MQPPSGNWNHCKVPSKMALERIEVGAPKRHWNSAQTWEPEGMCMVS